MSFYHDTALSCVSSCGRTHCVGSRALGRKIGENLGKNVRTRGTTKIQFINRNHAKSSPRSWSGTKKNLATLSRHFPGNAKIGKLLGKCDENAEKWSSFAILGIQSFRVVNLENSCPNYLPIARNFPFQRASFFHETWPFNSFMQGKYFTRQFNVHLFESF